MDYKVELAKKELFELLDKNPELLKYQESLNRAMNATEEHNRLKVLGVYLQYNLSDLKFELMELQKLLTI